MTPLRDGGHTARLDFAAAIGIRGQRLVIIPSEDLVMVRMGASEGPADLDLAGLGPLIAEVRAALRGV